MSRQFVIVLRILAVGSALTILACQIVSRQKQSAAAGDPGARGSEWASSSKSGPALTPQEVREVKESRDRARQAREQQLAPPQTAPVPATPPPAPASAPPAPVKPAPEHVRGFGSKSAPAITPADVRQMKQRIQQDNQSKGPLFPQSQP